MIGNDVIDLNLARAQSNWKRKGFLEKIFTIAEQELILSAGNSELMVWILWSRKEAAYKIYNRMTLQRAYNPTQFECSPMQYSSGFYYGEVKKADGLYFSKTEISLNFIHTIAVTKIEDFKKIEEQKLENICKKNGLPYISDLGKMRKPASISHHGDFQRIISLNSIRALI